MSAIGFSGLLAIVLGTSMQLASAEQISQMSIEGIKAASVFAAPKGCTITVKHRFWWDTKKSVDCFGILLRDVKGKDSFGNAKAYDAVALFPASQEQGEAGDLAEALALGLGINGRKPREGVTIDVSNLKVAESTIALSELTKDANDKDTVHYGGIGMKIVIVEGTIRRTRTMHMGLN